MRIGAATSLVFAAQLASALLRMVVSVITARVLGPEGRGLYAIFVSLTAMLSTVASLGLHQSAIFFTSKKEHQPTLLGNTLLMICASGAVLAIGLWGWQHFAGSVAVPGHLLWLGSMTGVLDHALTGFLLGAVCFSRYALYVTVQGVALLAGASLLLVVNASPELAIELKILADGSALGLLAAMLWRLGVTHGMRVERSLLVRQFLYGLNSNVMALINVAHYRVHLLVLAALSGEAAAGIFSVSLLLMEMITLGPNALGTVLLPKMSGMVDRKEAAQTAAMAIRQVLAVSTLLLAVAWFPVDWLIDLLFGAKFAEALQPARVAMAAAVLATPVQILTRFFTSEARQHVTTACIAISVGVAVAASYALIPSWGIMGAALALLASIVTNTSLMTFQFVRRSGVGLIEVLVPRPSDLATVVAAVRHMLPRKQS